MAITESTLSLAFWVSPNLRWPPQLTGINQHKNGYNSVKCIYIEPIFSAVVPESNSRNTLWVLPYFVKACIIAWNQAQHKFIKQNNILALISSCFAVWQRRLWIKSNFILKPIKHGTDFRGKTWFYLFFLTLATNARWPKQQEVSDKTSRWQFCKETNSSFDIGKLL